MKPWLALIGCALTAALITPRANAAAGIDQFGVVSAKVTIDGTSNLHEWTASSTAVRVTKLTIASGADSLQQALQPGGVEALEAAVAATSLSSPKEGLDKNMHKALKAQEHADITFKLRGLTPAGNADGATVPLRAVGTLAVAGVEKEVTFEVQAVRAGTRLTVTGGTTLLMTDFGIAPPKAMLGMLKTDPKVKVRIELVLTGSDT